MLETIGSGSLLSLETHTAGVNTLVSSVASDVDDDGFATVSAWGYQAGGGAEFRIMTSATDRSLQHTVTAVRGERRILDLAA